MDFIPLVALLIVIAVRSRLNAASQGAAVDHYYWLIVSREQRKQKKLSVCLNQKYILEESRQFYPPGYMVFLSLFPDWIIESNNDRLINASIDAVTLILISLAYLIMGGNSLGISILIIVYGLAPVIAAYNFQLSSRGLGALFIAIKMLSEVGAAQSYGFFSVSLWIVASIATACVILTHKMTTQFMIFSWPVWPFALGGSEFATVLAFLVPPAGLLIATSLTGTHFQARQWAAHAEIVRFWSRHWRDLGGHPFKRSALYGSPSQADGKTFHQPGLRGAGKHLTLIGSYLPLSFLLPLSILWSAPPPNWVMVWLLLALAVSILTLYVPFLRGFGGGHLYLFYAAPPAAIWWAILIERNEVLSLIAFAIGFAATFISLVVAIRRRKALSKQSDQGLEDALAALRIKPPSRVAAFPWTVPERIAFETHHSVFWGGHGAGLDKLEPYFPVMARTLREAFSEHKIRWVLLSATWWPEGHAAMRNEFPHAVERRFSEWILFDLHGEEPCR